MESRESPLPFAEIISNAEKVIQRLYDIAGAPDKINSVINTSSTKHDNVTGIGVLTLPPLNSELKSREDDSRAQLRTVTSNQFFYEDSPGVFCAVEVYSKLWNGLLTVTSSSSESIKGAASTILYGVHYWKAVNEMKTWTCLPQECSDLIIVGLLAVNLGKHEIQKISSLVRLPSGMLQAQFSVIIEVLIRGMSNNLMKDHALSQMNLLSDHKNECLQLYRAMCWMRGILQIIYLKEEAEKKVLTIFTHVIKLGILELSPSLTSLKENLLHGAQMADPKEYFLETPLSDVDYPKYALFDFIGAVELWKEKQQQLLKKKEELLAEHLRVIEFTSKEKKSCKFEDLSSFEGFSNNLNASEKGGVSRIDMAAAERDFRRRRLRYRSSKNKRDPKEIMRNLIECQMNAIMKTAVNKEKGDSTVSRQNESTIKEVFGREDAKSYKRKERDSVRPRR